MIPYKRLDRVLVHKGKITTVYTDKIQLPDGQMADYTIHFPLYDGVKEFYIALKKDAVLLKAESYQGTAPVVYYGSSITQGGCASRPGKLWMSPTA